MDAGDPFEVPPPPHAVAQAVATGIATRRPRNAMTIDVEDYYQVSALEPYVPRERWDSMPSRVEGNMERVLALLDEAGVRATFFVLGCVAERFPALVKRMVAGGHEVASHGYAHVRVTQQDQTQFRADAGRTKALLEDMSGTAVTGYRAASFSIDRSNPWAHDLLAELGYFYSSSVYPVRHDHYGIPDAPRAPYHVAGGALLEVPITTVRLLGRNLPCGGGGYFRLLPYAYFRWAIRRVNERDRMAGVFYLHPWEVDPQQPRIPGIDARTRFRHYTNLARTAGRLRRLLADFAWARMDEVFLNAGSIS